jgi:phage-related protein
LELLKGISATSRGVALYIKPNILRSVKPVAFEGDSLEALRAFPESACREAGFQLDRVQRGLDPNDFKPMPTVGRGAYEIRIRDKAGAFRVVYVAKLADAIHVLHAFQKKTKKTSKADVKIAKQRLTALMER